MKSANEGGNKKIYCVGSFKFGRWCKTVVVLGVCFIRKSLQDNSLSGLKSQKKGRLGVDGLVGQHGGGHL